MTGKTGLEDCEKTLFLTHGIPGSGKSTWARAHMPKERIVRTDEIRFELWENIASRGQKIDIAAIQPITWELTKRKARGLMQDGHAILIDACNTNRKTLDEWASIADEHGYELVLVDFSDVKLKTCLEHNSQRMGWEYVWLDIILKHLGNLITTDVSNLKLISHHF